MEIQVDVGGFPEAPQALLERALTAVIGHDGREHTEISLALVDDARIRELNRDYLDRDGTTDVIAFALVEELLRLAVHGALHVLGHDHPEGAERTESPMFVLQERLLAQVLAEGE